MKTTNTLLLTLSLFILFLNSFSQNKVYSVEEYEVVKQKKTKVRPIFLKKTNNGNTLVIREYISNNTYSDKESYFIEIYNPKKKLITKHKFKHKRFHNIWVKNDSLYLAFNDKEYFSDNNREPQSTKKIRSLQVKALVSSVKNFKFSEKILSQIQKPDTQEFNSLFFSNLHRPTSYTTICSLNKKYIAIIFRVKSNKLIESNIENIEVLKPLSKQIKNNKTYSEVFKVLMYEKDSFQLIYKKDFVLNHKFYWADYNNKYFISEYDGSLFFFENVQDSKTNFFKGSYQQITNLVKVNSETLIRKKIKTYADDIYLESYKLCFFKNKLFLAGSYASNKDNGIFKYNLNPTDLNLLYFNYFPYSKQFYNDRVEILKSRKKRKAKEEAYNINLMHLNDIFIDNDENMILNIVEFKNRQYASVSTGFGGIPSVDGVYSYEIYNNAIVAKIAKNNQLAWSRCLSIRAEHDSKNQYNYFSLFNGKSNFLIYNNKTVPKFNIETKLIEINVDGNILYHKEFISDKNSNVRYDLTNIISKTKNNNNFYVNKTNKKEHNIIGLTF